MTHKIDDVYIGVSALLLAQHNFILFFAILGGIPSSGLSCVVVNFMLCVELSINKSFKFVKTHLIEDEILNGLRLTSAVKDTNSSISKFSENPSVGWCIAKIKWIWRYARVNQMLWWKPNPLEIVSSLFTRDFERPKPNSGKSRLISLIKEKNGSHDS